MFRPLEGGFTNMTQSFVIPGVSRRVFLGTAAAAAGAATLPAFAAPAKATRYTRYNAVSPQGKVMLDSYAVAIGKMLELKPDHPHNWFRNAFVHCMDCPHGNWWFFTWHRPFVGYFEQVVRHYSGNPDFAFPYWDWTQAPLVPAQMFDGVLDPRNQAYDRYISSFDTFYKYMNPAMEVYWRNLTPDQRKGLPDRGMPDLPTMWKVVKGNETDGAYYATTPNARWIKKIDPLLDKSTRGAVEIGTIEAGLRTRVFVDGTTVSAGFNSSRTASHNSMPSRSNFAILEGQPHNLVHNNLGGVGHLSNPLLFGYMADNLSPVDPLFMLHHSNVDRLWDVWTRKQQALHLPALPTGADWTAFADEKFLFYIDANGTPAPRKTAGESVEIAGFDYTYQPGSGENVVTAPRVSAVAAATFSAKSISGGAGTVNVPAALLAKAPGTLVATITIPRPTSGGAPREYDVLVNAPPGTTSATPDSPYYAGTISFFGFMASMGGEASFSLPLTKLPPAAKGKPPGELVFTVVPSYETPATPGVLKSSGPLLKAVTVTAS